MMLYEWYEAQRALLSPFSESMRSPSFPPSQDPEGFDRAAFHVELNDEVLSFLTA